MKIPPITGQQRINRRKSVIVFDSLKDLISNSVTKSHLSNFRGMLVRWFHETHPLEESFQKLLKEKEGLDVVSKKIQDECWNRHNSLLKAINYGNLAVNESLDSLLKGYNWAILSQESAQLGLANDEADEAVWLNFAVKVRGSKLVFPSRLDSDYEEIIQEMRTSAYKYYYAALGEALKNMDATELCKVLYYITKFSSATLLIDMVLTRVIQKCSPEVFKSEVTPRFMLLCCLGNDDSAILLDFFLTKVNYDVDEDTINAVLELASYNLNSSCYKLMVKNDLNNFISIEGVLCSLLGICLVGNRESLSITTVLVTDRIKNALFLKNEPEISKTQQEVVDKWTSFIAPFIYTFFLLLLEGSGKEDLVPAMLSFYQNSFKGLLASHMQPILMHEKFTRAFFQRACDCNLPQMVSLMLEYQWAPSDLTNSLLRSAEMGHQRLFSTILFSLLDHDPRIKCMSGSVPKVFMKPKVLNELPILAKRFPVDVSTFMEKLSHLPVPICVPTNKDNDAFCKSKSVRGLKLGYCKLTDVLNRPLPGTSNDFLWKKLTFEGTLRKSAPIKDKQNEEVDSVICMAPMCFVTDVGSRDPTQSERSISHTNPIIRLLNLNHEFITLQPLSQVLVEFHWSQAKIWRRVILKFLFVFTFFACKIYTFILVAESQTSGIEVPHIHAMGAITFIFSICLLFQEFRQMSYDLGDYVTSMGNFFDLTIHSLVIYVIITGIFLGNYVPVLLLAITIVVGAVRLLSHLGIIPSIGPLYRSWEMAFLKGAPLVIPMGVMIVTYSLAIFVAQHGKVTTHFNTISNAIQTCLNMATWNYEGLDNVANPEIFTLKILFHTTFILFLLNLISAITTVNLAKCFKEANNEFLLQMSSTMVELEMYWFSPSNYDMSLKNNMVEDGKGKSRNTWVSFKKNNSGWPFTFGIKKTFPILEDQENTLAGSPSAEIEDCMIVLYTCPIKMAKRSIWWNDFPGKSKNENMHTEQENDLNASTDSFILSKSTSSSNLLVKNTIKSRRKPHEDSFPDDVPQIVKPALRNRKPSMLITMMTEHSNSQMELESKIMSDVEDIRNLMTPVLDSFRSLIAKKIDENDNDSKLRRLIEKLSIPGDTVQPIKEGTRNKLYSNINDLKNQTVCTVEALKYILEKQSGSFSEELIESPKLSEEIQPQPASANIVVADVRDIKSQLSIIMEVINSMNERRKVEVEKPDIAEPDILAPLDIQNE